MSNLTVKRIHNIVKGIINDGGEECVLTSLADVLRTKNNNKEFMISFIEVLKTYNLRVIFTVLKDTDNSIYIEKQIRDSITGKPEYYGEKKNEM